MSTPTIDRSLRLSADRYVKEEWTKKALCLHHTVGGGARSTFEWWQQSPSRICTAFIIERNGIIYEVFDPKYEAWHLGGASALGVPYSDAVRYNYETIGIELASEGALRSGYELNTMLEKFGLEGKFDENYLYAFDIDPDPDRPENRWFTNAKKLYNKKEDKHKFVDLSENWRGYRYFDAYDVPQVESLHWLINKLCNDFNIPKKLIEGDRNRYDKSVLDHMGVFSHSNVRRDKTDVHKAFDWNELQKYLEIHTYHRWGTI